MKALILLILYGAAVIYPTIPGTTLRDHSRPAIVINEYGEGYQTIPGTTLQDHSRPGFVIERDPGFDADAYPSDEGDYEYELYYLDE